LSDYFKNSRTNNTDGELKELNSANDLKTVSFTG
jgi:hypothetical protein